MDEIPQAVIINWNQTGINTYVPVGSWTMEIEGAESVEKLKIIGIDDKEEMTALFAGSMKGTFTSPNYMPKENSMECV